MPLLTPGDRLTQGASRILVAGTSGAGKTTMARLIADTLAIESVEIDGLYHGPGWTRRPTFEAEVASFAAGDRWVTEWQYQTVRPLLADRADLVVWLDLGRYTVMRQVARRTIIRRLAHQELWNGNREPPLWTIVRDPDHILRWAWSTHHQTEERITELIGTRPELPVIRLATRREMKTWVEGPLLDLKPAT